MTVICDKFLDITCEMTEDDDYENETVVPELPEEVRYRRMPRMAHTIQLLIKKVYVNYYGHVLEKTRFLVSKLRKSSEAVQKLVAKCGKTVVSDNSTRWNSTYYMVHRLLDVCKRDFGRHESRLVDSSRMVRIGRIEEFTGTICSSY